MSGPPPGRLHWHAVRTRSRFDFVVRDALLAASVEAWLPTVDETTKWSDREKRIVRPLFAGYVFARLAPDQYGSIRITRGVVQILSLDNEPEAIPDAEIANLQRITASSLALAPCPYVTGESVTIKSGPLYGVSGIVVRTKGSTRIVVRCEILRRAVSVEVDAADVATVA